MKLSESTVDVFLSTIDQQSPVTAKPAGRLSASQNAIVKRYENPRAADGTVTHVSVEKRNGYTTDTNVVLDNDGFFATPPALNGTPQVLFGGGDALRLVAGNRLYTKSKTWVKAANQAEGDAIVLPQTVRTTDLYAANSTCDAPDMAVIGDVACTVWRENATQDSNNASGLANVALRATPQDGVRIMFRDQTNDSPIRTAFTYDPAGIFTPVDPGCSASPNGYQKVRVLAQNGLFWVLQDYLPGGGVTRIYVTVFGPTGALIASTHIDTPVNGALWDSAVITNIGVVIAMPNNGSGVKFTAFTYASGAFATSSNTDTSLLNSLNMCAWLTDDAATSLTGYLVTVDGTAGSRKAWAYRIVSLAQNHIYPQVNPTITISSTTQVVSGITGYTVPGTTGLVVALTAMDSFGAPDATTYTTGANGSNSSASNNFPDQLDNITWCYAVPFAGASTLTLERRALSLMSRAFALGGDYVAIAYYPACKLSPLEQFGAAADHFPVRPINPSNFQPTWYVIPLASKQRIAGRLEYGLAAADWQVLAIYVDEGSITVTPRNNCLTSVSVTANGALTLPLCFRADQNLPVAGAFSNVATGTNPSSVPSGLPSFAAIRRNIAVNSVAPSVANGVAAAVRPQQAAYQTATTVGVREFRFGPDCGQAFSVGQATYVPGMMAAIVEPGDTAITEHGIVAPECPRVKLSALSAVVAAPGAFFYRCVAEYTAGTKTYQSLPSAAFGFTAKAGDNKAFAVTSYPLSPTNKKNIRLSLYRTGIVDAGVIGGAVVTSPPTVNTPATSKLPTTGYYKVTNDLQPQYNLYQLGAGGLSVYNDYLEAYTQGTGEQLYTDLGALPKFPCPAFRAGCVWQNRAWVVGYDNALWFSGEITEGQGEWFNPGLRVVVPTTEEVTGIAAMEHVLLVFCANSIWYIPLGQALPGNDGSGTVPTPIRLPFEMGGTGFAAVIRQGCMYSSSAGGIWCITRALDNEWTGQRAQADLAPEILDMVEAGNYVVAYPDSSSNYLMAFDTNLGGWSKWLMPSQIGKLAAWRGASVYADDTRVWEQQPDTWFDNDTVNGVTYYVPMCATVAPVHIAGVRSWKRTWALQLEGQTYDPCGLTVGLAYTDTGVIDVTYKTVPLTPGELEEEYRPTKQLTSSIGLEVCDSAPNLVSIAAEVAPIASCATAMPTIPGTVANWPLQGDFLDTSGNGLTLAPVAASTNAPAAAPPFIALADKTNGVIVNDSCLVGVQLESETKLMAPATALLRFAGAFTFEWLMLQRFTYTFAYFACADPGGRSGGRGADRIGSLYTGWSGSGNPAISDQHIGSNLPTPGYGSFPGYNDHTLFNWADAGQPAIGDWHTHHMAMTHDGSGNYRAYRDGVYIGGFVASAGANTPVGNERFFLGNIELTFLGMGGGGVYASMRALNYERSQPDIAGDAAGFHLSSTRYVQVDDVTKFIVGATYVSYTPGTFAVDVGAFTVLAINPTTKILTVTASGGWSVIAGHVIISSAAIGGGRGFSFEVVSFAVGLEKGLNKIAPGKRGRAP